MKKLTAILLALMTMTAFSCSSKPASSEPEGSVAETVALTQTAFSETQIPLEYPIDRPVKMAMHGDDCYFFYISRQDMRCAVINSEDQVTSDTALGTIFSSNMGFSPIMNEDGGFSIVYPVSDFPFEYDEFGQMTNYGDFIINGEFSFMFASFDSAGNKLSETEIIGMRKVYQKSQSQLNGIYPYGDDLILSIGNGLVLLDREGTLKDSAHFDMQLFSLGCDRDGNVIISSAFTYGIMDGSTLELPESLMDEPVDHVFIEGSAAAGAGSYSYYFPYNDGIYGFDENGEKHLDFAFAPSFVDYADVSKCYTARNENQFLTAAYNSNCVLLYTRRPEDYSADRVELDLWQINGGSSCEFVTMFNKSNDRFTVNVAPELKDTEQLSRALLTDKGPDIILHSGNQLISDLANLGALADMNKLMEEYGGISKDDLLPNVVKAYDMNGSIYALPDTFDINILAANKEVVPRDMIDWIYDDLIDIFEAQPEGTLLFSSHHSTPFMYLVVSNMDVWMDFENGVSRFNSPEFIRVLEFCKKTNESYPAWDYEMSEIEYAEEQIKTMKSLNEKTAMMEPFTAGCSGLTTIISELGQRGIFLEDSSILKYPDGGGTGYISYGNLVSVMENSKCKEGAWAFASFYLSPDYHRQFGYHGINFANKELFEKGIEVTISESGQRTMRDGTYYYDNGNIALDFSFPADATAEEAAYYRDIVLSCDRLATDDLALSSILLEEFDRYVNDEITAEECAEIIGNRIDIYISERS